MESDANVTPVEAVIAGPPMPDAADVAVEPSVQGQYAMRSGRFVLLVTSRKIGDLTWREPWPRRRMMPAASNGTHTSLPLRSQRCGHWGTSPQKRRAVEVGRSKV